MKVMFTPQFNTQEIIYDNDLENDIVMAFVNGEVIKHDLSNYERPTAEEEDNVEPPGFPIVGYPQRIDGELHVTLVRWYS